MSKSTVVPGIARSFLGSSLSLVLKVKHPELLENFVALSQEPGLRARRA